MNFNNHSNLVGQHAFLGASKYHWLNYDATKIAEAYRAAQAVQMGTKLHAFAAECIELRQRLPKSRKTLNMYVNDAIGYNLKPEQVLYYSQNCFGTADAIDMRGDLLRIHDLKTGKVPAHMEQLMLFMLLSGNMTIIAILVSMVVNCKRVSTTGFHRVSTKPTSNLAMT